MFALGAYRTRDPRIVGIGVDEYKRVVSATVALLGVLAMLCLLFQVDIARSYFALAFPLGVAGLIASRWVLRRWLTRQRTKGHFLSQVLVLGKPKDVSYVVNQIEKKSGAAYHVVGVCLTGNAGMKWLNLGRRAVPVVPEARSIVEAVREFGADAVIVAGPGKGGGKYIQELGWQLEESATELILTTGLTNVAGPRIHARPVEGLPLMHVELPQYTGARHTLKRLFDIVASASGSAFPASGLPAARHPDQARQPRQGLVPPGTGGQGRQEVPDGQVPLHGGIRRGRPGRAAGSERGSRNALQDAARPPGD